jgi:hypothetical protein
MTEGEIIEREREAYRNGDYWFEARYLPPESSLKKWTEDDWIRYIRKNGGWS